MLLLQKIGGMFQQEALAVPAPALNQASPAASQAMMDTTSYSLQGQGGISFSQSQSQVGMHALQFLSLARPYMQAKPQISNAWRPFYPNFRASFFSGQWQLPDSISGRAKTGTAQSIGVQQHVLLPVGEEKEMKQPILTIGTAYMQGLFLKVVGLLN